MGKTYLFLLGWVFGGIFSTTVSFAAQNSLTSYSKYGQIQNVQNYSANSLYRNGVYNPKGPQAIYTTGTDLTTGDCRRVVENLISNECAQRNNCFGMRISDIRPTLMVRLSQLPGHNFATSCSGYIDTIFNEYLAQTGSNTGTKPTAIAFPTSSGVHNTNSGAQFAVPISTQQREIQERANEMMEAQRQNETLPVGITATDFPTSYADLSLSDRMAVASEGLEPFKDLEAFHPIEIESYQDYLARTQNKTSGNSTIKPNDQQQQPENQTIMPSGCQTGDSPDCAITLVLN